MLFGQILKKIFPFILDGSILVCVIEANRTNVNDPGYLLLKIFES